MIPSHRKYAVIYADPPWHYTNGGIKGAAAHHYVIMKTADIAALPVKSLALSNAFLFLWATMPLLPDALRVMQAWGFRFRTVAFTWVKTAANGRLAHGQGYYTRANAELCLLGVRGRPTRHAANVHSVVMTRRGRHSEKPHAVRDRIVQLCGDVARIELFARKRYAGWDTWGNQVNGHIETVLKKKTAYQRNWYDANREQWNAYQRFRRAISSANAAISRR